MGNIPSHLREYIFREAARYVHPGGVPARARDWWMAGGDHGGVAATRAALGGLQGHQGKPLVVVRGLRRRDDRGRVHLGRLGDRRHGARDGRGGGNQRARRDRGSHLRGSLPDRKRRAWPAGGAEGTPELEPGLVHREGRLGDYARQGQADHYSRTALRRPARGTVTAAGVAPSQGETAGIWLGEAG